MLRKNNKGVTAMQILQNGGSREHFEGLQNSSLLLARLGTKASRLGIGTTRNEQLHRELNHGCVTLCNLMKDGYRLLCVFLLLQRF